MIATPMRRRLAGAGLCTLLASLGAEAHAQGLIPTHRVSAALALEAVGAAVAHCAEQGYAVSAVLLDASGTRQAILRGDRAGIHTIDSAMGKAYTANSFTADSGAVAERLMGNPASAGLQHVPGVILARGGVPIQIGDEVVGALGVGGAPAGDKAEACARAGLDKIRDRLK